ncbi:uncharacterized protein LY79DRAFT_577176 [Colletotrichum navitas]|uniref:Uncharacterized protein n=1 Tax=Colletotrichum navitas TaxID=681940 RepID=A0AAD8V860_9PEZI|nr:uncharacterized protein LY79DRAFT_577176 [Colletotrichum navitas]KAK1596599.1 hypothetical protein LY79DRAFT_577176 [Colletotrichum navitas]
MTGNGRARQSLAFLPLTANRIHEPHDFQDWRMVPRCGSPGCLWPSLGRQGPDIPPPQGTPGMTNGVLEKIRRRPGGALIENEPARPPRQPGSELPPGPDWTPR